MLNPYLQSNVITIYNGDCLDILKLLPNNSVNLIVTDPPYHSTKKSNITGDKNFKTDKDYLNWLEKIAQQWQRILTPNGSLYCFASLKMSAQIEVMLARYFNILSSITWTKPNEPGFDGWKQKMKKESLRSWYLHSERIIFAESASQDNLHSSSFGTLLRKMRKAIGLSTIQLTEMIGEYGKINHGGAVSNWETGRNIPTPEQYQKLQNVLAKFTQISPLPDYEKVIRPFFVNSNIPYTDVWDFPSVKPYSGKHPAEKPLDLITHIIKASSYSNSIILDCFAGSGVVGEACKLLNRQAILIEIEEHWCQKIALRCSETIPCKWENEPLFKSLKIDQQNYSQISLNL